MRIHAITAVGVPDPSSKNPKPTPLLFIKFYELGKFSFMQRSPVKQTIKFITRGSLNSLGFGARCSASDPENPDLVVHIKKHSSKNLALCVFTSPDYPKRSAYTFLNQYEELFWKHIGDKYRTYSSDQNLSLPGLKELFIEWKNGGNDQLAIAENKVDQIEGVLVQNLKALLEQQGNLDELVEKSDDLKGSTKVFYKNSKKMNKKCCNLI